ncbi:MAG: phosphoribosylformylglycinamidine synthase [Acetivibrionales bacterium]|jgi:phosphoribosylformylglycinamidine synthase
MKTEMDQRKKVRRIFTEKKKGFDIEAENLYKDLKLNLRVDGLNGVRIIYRYDISGITDKEYNDALNMVFSDPPVDMLYEEDVRIEKGKRAFATEYLPGQYDQRADSISQCVQFLTLGERPRCRTAKLIVLDGTITDEEFQRIKEYCVNPIECRIASMDKPETLDAEIKQPDDVPVVEGFCGMDSEELARLHNRLGLAMSLDDLEFCRNYFRDEERRDPTMTEIRMIDTYWSDHCRHTTFMSKIEEIRFEEGPYASVMKDVYKRYISSRENVYGNEARDICLMDLATIAMKEMRKTGKLEDLEVSDEINASSIVIEAEVNGRKEEWLVMFKNETHNHPTEIEPFGGAATCLGGAIRDPLSGRAYVYQAMRVTGSGDPRTEVEDTLPGKLPQRKITTNAAAGYSSYGNQVGVATGQVSEIYDEGYVAKRMELGAVIGAAPRRNVVRMRPEAGDRVILLGGRTGRDGCGGATGSSKEHDEQSLLKSGAEVQKGNPPTERKILRLFRNETVTRMIKKCNDFGAGGVSVAIGELAESLDIDLDKVPVKYEGLDGTEIAISESQERMAVVVSEGDEERFIRAAEDENLEATRVAVVTNTGRLRMKWRGKTLVDISRKFLDTNGVRQSVKVLVKSPEKSYFTETSRRNMALTVQGIREGWIRNLQRLESCCQKGLVERFDSTVGAATVLMPFGGKYQLSPAEGMAAKLPVLDGDTTTCTMMTYGFNPAISKLSPFHGAVYAVVEAVAKIVAMGGDYRKTRMSFQEYFERLGTEPSRWGKPFSALLGAYYAQMELGIPSVGGKDSMSGSFRDIDVPPTLVAFAVAINDAGRVISTEFKKTGSPVVLLRLDRDRNDLPDFEQMKKNFSRVFELASQGKILSAHTVRHGGAAEAISRMCFGNMTGMEINSTVDIASLFRPDYGSLILEIDGNEDAAELFNGLNYTLLGHTTGTPSIVYGGYSILLDNIVQAWKEPLEKVFPAKAADFKNAEIKTYSYHSREEDKGGIMEGSSKDASPKSVSKAKPAAKPRVFIPVFPGTICEYDIMKAFSNAGGAVDIFVIKNLTPAAIDESISAMRRKIEESQILVFPGGFSAGDGPEGSGKFVATVFSNPYLKEAVLNLLDVRDGLILGIGDGFQALLKMGLLPYGEFRNPGHGSPALTFNTIGRHVSCMVLTKVASDKSPWFSNVKVGDVHVVPISHGEGRFVASEEQIAELAANGQIATQYVDFNGAATYDARYNPSGSMHAIEGITSPDGRILGKMAHSERKGLHVCKNIPGCKDQLIFEAGVQYFG